MWNVALYEAETWTMSNTVIKKIEAFEVWLEKNGEDRLDSKS